MIPADDAQHLPLCWCVRQERHPGCATSNRDHQLGQEHQDAQPDCEWQSTTIRLHTGEPELPVWGVLLSAGVMVVSNTH
jgi:hypothetical protein